MWVGPLIRISICIINHVCIGVPRYYYFCPVLMRLHSCGLLTKFLDEGHCTWVFIYFYLQFSFHGVLGMGVKEVKVISHPFYLQFFLAVKQCSRHSNDWFPTIFFFYHFSWNVLIIFFFFISGSSNDEKWERVSGKLRKRKSLRGWNSITNNFNFYIYRFVFFLNQTFINIYFNHCIIE